MSNYMNIAKKLALTLTGLVASSVFISTIAFAEGNVANGQKLFTGSKCNQCHGTDIFTKPSRKVTTLPGLEAQVRRCDSNLNTNWFDDEIIDVTAYLNKQYYKF